MIPTPDWNRLRPHPLPPSTLRGGGCGDASGCLLGCGGILAVGILALAAANTFGPWAGLGALVLLGFLAQLLGKAPRLIPGLLLGALSAVGVAWLMRLDYANQPGRILASALVPFLLFTLAGYWEQKRKS